MVEAAEQAYHDYQFDANGKLLPGRPEPPGPAWLRNLFGVDFLCDVRSLFYQQATDADLELLKELTSLEGLCLDRSQLTDAGLVHLKGLTSLQVLVTTGPQVTDAGLEHLKGLTSLEWLELRHAQVTDEGVKKLRKALPNCKIHH